jgi:hemerythrin superfamily protein
MSVADDQNVIAVLIQDHEEAKELLARVASSTGDEKEDAFRDLVSELARHETVEEEIVYPVVRQTLVGGEELAERRMAEEKEAAKLLSELEGLKPATKQFDTKFEKLHEAVLAHAAAEESEVFPRLAVMEDKPRLEAMGRLVNLAKKTAPTHPHPTVTGSPTANVLLGPMAAVADRTRDAIRGAREKIAG